MLSCAGMQLRFVNGIGFVLLVFFQIVLQAQEPSTALATPTKVPFVSYSDTQKYIDLKGQKKSLKNDVRFTLEDVNSKISPLFQGALFECNPYCQFLSLRMNNKWMPELNQVKAYSYNLRLMDREDPLFLILFPSQDEKKKPDLVVQPEEPKKNEDVHSNEKEKSLIVKPSDKNEEEPDPVPPPFPFKNGLRISPSVRLTNFDIKTNSNVQREFKASFPLTADLNLSLGYMRGQPKYFLGKWFQFEVNYGFDLYAMTMGLENKTKYQIYRNELDFTVWHLPETPQSFKYGIELSSIKNQYTVSVDQIKSFSFSEKIQSLGLVIKRNRFVGKIRYPFSLLIIENQPFRDQLKNAAMYEAELMYCDKQGLLYGAQKYTSCYKIGYNYSSNDATYKAIYSTTLGAQLKKQEIRLSYTMNLGEDFLK